MATTYTGPLPPAPNAPLCHIITPVGMLGYGFDENLTKDELRHLVSTGTPTAIILDSGSTDSGPQKLALGSMSCPRSAYAADLEKLLRLAHSFGVPLIVGSVGGDGTDEHVREIGEILEEITDSNPEYLFKTTFIFSGIDKSIILNRLRDGRITGCGPSVPPLTETDILEPPRVVAQMGTEPFIDAMAADPEFDIIIGGRAYDPAPYAAYCVHQLRLQTKDITPEDINARMGGFLHMGKIMECGGHCSTPKSHGAVATVYVDGSFDVAPMAASSICTPASVAAHALYENTRPDILRGPGGVMMLDESSYEALPDGRSVRVRGTRFCSSRSGGQAYQLKLEAARVVGYRTLFMCSIKDPILIRQLDKVLPLVKDYVGRQHKHVTTDWDIGFHVHGKEGNPSSSPAGIFVVVEAMAQTQEIANSLASKARVAMIHAPYPNQKATSGNVGFGVGGLMELETGPCAEFSVYHLMDLEPGEERLSSSTEEKRLIRSETRTIGTVSHRSSHSSEISNFTKGYASSPSLAPSEKAPTPKLTTQPPSPNPRVLSDYCHVFRSKNAGPYEITIDALFYTQADYHRLKTSNILTRERVAQAIGIQPSDVIWMGYYDPALAFKVTFPRVRGGRRKAAGGFMEGDVHGSQEHTGLAQLGVPSGGRWEVGVWSGWVVRRKWKSLMAVLGGLGVVMELWRGVRRRRKRRG